MIPSGRNRQRVVLLLGLGVAALAGCGYAVGNAFQAPVETISVSIVQSESFRRGLEFQLTEAIHREIQLRWPSLRIVHDGQADTKLVGRIIQAEKYPLTPTPFDDPRELEFQLAVEVRWEDLRTGQTIACQNVPISPDAIGLVSTATFAPETGQSRATAERKSIDVTARQIVDLMETPW